MKTHFKFFTLAVALMFFFACSEDAVITDKAIDLRNNGNGNSNPVIEKITGSGHFEAAAGDWRTFTVQASKYADGTVDGHYQRTRRLDGNANNEFTGSGDVLCFTIDGDYAWMVGEEEIDGEDTFLAWRIYDGGNGNQQDSLTQQSPFTNPDLIPIICDDLLEFGTLVQVEAGNLKFHIYN